MHQCPCDLLLAGFGLSMCKEESAPVSSSLGIKASGCNGIHLINEDDGRRILLGQPEHIPDHSGALHASKSHISS